MSHDTDRIRASVEAHLDIVRRDNETLEREISRYVHYARRYGWTVEEIALQLQIDPFRVHVILSEPPHF